MLCRKQFTLDFSNIYYSSELLWKIMLISKGLWTDFKNLNV